MHANEQNKGAFKDWNVILFLESNEKQEGFERLVKAGGAQLLNINKYIENFNNHDICPTHIFIEKSFQNNFSNDILDLFSQFTQIIYQVNFLADFLLKYSEFNSNNYVLQLDFSNKLAKIPKRRSTRKRKPSIH